MKLGWFVVLGFRWILAEEKDQPTVVDVERVVMSVHLCSTEHDGRSGYELKCKCLTTCVNMLRMGGDYFLINIPDIRLKRKYLL